MTQLTPQEQATLDREIGRMQGRLGALENRQQEFERRVEKDLLEIRQGQKVQQESLDNIEGILLQIKGALKLGGLIGAAIAGIGGFITWLLGLWSFGNGGGA